MLQAYTFSLPRRAKNLLEYHVYGTSLVPNPGTSLEIRWRARLPELTIRKFPDYPQSQIKVSSDIAWGGQLNIEGDRLGEQK